MRRLGQSRAVPWAVTALALAAAAGGFVLLAANGAPDLPEQIALSAAFLGYALVGALIASLRPGNRIGWVLIAIPTLTGIGFTAEQYAVFAATTPSPMPAEVLAAWLATWAWYPGLGLLGFGLLLYPSGRLASHRWRPIAWLLGISIALISALFAFSPTPVGDGPFTNPLAVLPSEAIAALEGVSSLLFLVTIVASAAAPLVRMRTARGIERQQLKWFLAAASLLALTLAISLFAAGSPLEWFSNVVLFPAALAAVPLAIGVAILRYRLFDIDLIINRTLVYGALTVVLALVYTSAVLVLQGLLSPITGGGTLAVAASTLAVAALFQPLRSRIQRVVDRRFYRARYDLTRTVEAFSQRLRDQLDLESLSHELLTAAEGTMHPVSATVWLREGASSPAVTFSRRSPTMLGRP
jgi:hypothetical protein